MLIITAGGTGGHLFPAIALAQAFRSSFPHEKVLLVGTLTPIDKEIYAISGFEFKLLSFNRPSGGIKGKLKLLFQMILSVFQAIIIIRKNKPKLVAACGGFGCIPLAIAARLTFTPFILLEQNVIPGRTNRFLASKAAFIFAEFAESRPYFPNKSAFIHIGNPIRNTILGVDKTHIKNSIIFMGGSQGSTKINDTAFAIIPEIIKIHPEINFYHLTGKAGIEKYKQNEKYPQVKVLPFLDKMEEIYVSAKLIIGRSGATSIAEIAALGIPSIFIPYPYAKDDHQKANAKALEDIGAGIMLEESTLTSELLKAKILELLNDSGKAAKISDAILQWSKPNAGKEIILVLRDAGLLK